MGCTVVGPLRRVLGEIGLARFHKRLESRLKRVNALDKMPLYPLLK